MTAPTVPTPPARAPEPAAGRRGRARRRPSTASVVLTVCRDDLLHIARDRTALAFMVVLPVVVIVIIGATIGAAPSNLPVGLVDADGSPAAAALRHRIEASGALSVRAYASADDLRQDVRVQVVPAGLVIPAGFGAALDRPGSDPVALTMVVDPTQPSAQAVATVVQSAVAHEGNVLAAARFATEQVGGDPAADRARARDLAEVLPTVPVRTESQGETTGQENTNRYTYTTVSNLTLFVFINTLAGAAALIERRRLGISRRMLAGPLTTAAVVAGTGLSRFAIALGQGLLIVAVGTVAFGVRWGDPLAAALIVVVFAALATSLALVVGSTARSPDQAQAVAIPIAIGMAMLGGCMWPLEVVPPALRALGHLTPHAWAMDAWIKVVYEGGTVGAIATELAVLAGATAVLAGVATVALRRSLTEG